LAFLLNRLVALFTAVSPAELGPTLLEAGDGYAWFRMRGA